MDFLNPQEPLPQEAKSFENNDSIAFYRNGLKEETFDSIDYESEKYQQNDLPSESESTPIHKKGIILLEKLQKTVFKTLDLDRNEFLVQKKVRNEDELQAHLYLKDKATSGSLKNIVTIDSSESPWVSMRAGEFSLQDLIKYFESKTLVTKSPSLVHEKNENYLTKFIRKANQLNKFDYSLLIIMILEDVLSGLKCLNREKMAHWDLKPANIVCFFQKEFNDVPKFELIDIEIPPQEENNDGKIKNVPIYTKQFVAPERKFTNFIESSSLADMYSLGLILEILLDLTKKFPETENWTKHLLCQKIMSFLKFVCENLLSKNFMERKNPNEVEDMLEELKKNNDFTILERDRHRVFALIPINEIKAQSFKIDNCLTNVNNWIKKLYTEKRECSFKLADNYQFYLIWNKIQIDSSFVFNLDQTSNNLNLFYQILCEIEYSSLDNPWFFIELYNSRIITKGMLCESFGHFNFNLGRFNEALTFFQKAANFCKKEKRYSAFLRNLLYVLNTQVSMKKIKHTQWRKYRQTQKKILKTNFIPKKEQKGFEFLYYKSKALKLLLEKNQSRYKKYFQIALDCLKKANGESDKSIVKFTAQFLNLPNFFTKEESYQIFQQLEKDIARDDFFGKVYFHESLFVHYNKYEDFKIANEHLEQVYSYAEKAFIRLKSPLVMKWNYYKAIIEEKLKNIDASFKFLEKNNDHMMCYYNYSLEVQSKHYAGLLKMIVQNKKKENRDAGVQAIESCLKSINSGDIYDFNLIAYIYSNIASFYQKIEKNYQEAIIFYLEAKKYYVLCSGEESNYTIMRDLFISECFYKLKDFQLALDFVKKPLRNQSLMDKAGTLKTKILRKL